MKQPAAGDKSTAIPPSCPPQANLADGSFYTRRCITEDPSWSLVTVPHLTELCIQHIVHNFEKNPILNYLLPEHQRKVVDRLSTSLPLTVTANIVSHEDYWKRCCIERWQVCDVSNYGDSWKRMFFERHLENILKFFIPSTTDPKKVLELVPLCKGYVRKLEVDQFLPPVWVDEKEESNDLADTEEDANFNEAYTHHYDLKDLITALPHLEELHLTYGVKSCGMNFEWSLFNFTEQDCFSLAAAVKMCHNLKDGGKQLLEGLANNKTLTKLDLRHTEVEQETGFLIHQIVWANREAARLGSLQHPTAEPLGIKCSREQ